MNILLVSPAGSDIYAKVKSQLPPLGLGYIAAVVREEGHDVKIVDLGLDKKALTGSLIDGSDVVGISADTTRYPEAVEIAKRVKDSGKIVVMGGYHVSFLDKEALDTGVVDFIVRGEGEYIFLELIKTLEEQGDLHKVKGISWLDNGEYVRNAEALPPKDLDLMPMPARDLMSITEYANKMDGMPFTNLVTSRGCPFNCYFCSSSKFGGLAWRFRSAKSVADEIEFLYHTYGYKSFSIMDDNFTLSPKRVFDFADEVEARGLTDIKWWCFSRIDILLRNEDMVKRMAEVGAYMIFLGLESSNEEVLDAYNKNIGNDDQQKAVELLRKYGIEIHGSYIIGDIHETEEMINNTINWARKVNARTTQFSILTPYPGTALYEDISRENRFLHKKWELYDALHPTIKLDNLKPEQVSKLLIKAYKKVYLNPSRILNPRFNSKRKAEKTKNGYKHDGTSLWKKMSNISKVIYFMSVFRKEIMRKDY